LPASDKKEGFFEAVISLCLLSADFRNDILINLSASLGLLSPGQLGLTSANLLNLRRPYQTVSPS